MITESNIVNNLLNALGC